jgi:hypothetical protein
MTASGSIVEKERFILAEITAENKTRQETVIINDLSPRLASLLLTLFHS